jgi:RHS repeat-associated protein
MRLCKALGVATLWLGFSGGAQAAEFPTETPLPRGLGAARSLSVSPSNGAATDGFAFELPPGRGGMEPKLSVLYNSFGGTALAGAGWSLEAGSIELQGGQGLPRVEGEPTFVFRLAGTVTELVELEDGSYRAKDESTFRQYRRVGSHWEVRDASGNLYILGESASNRQDGSIWMLERVSDAHSNYMTFGYLRDEGTFYLRQVDYAGHSLSGTAPINQVLIDYTPRSDARVSYELGFRQTRKLLPALVSVYQSSALIRGFSLGYDVSATSGKALLAWIDTSVGSTSARGRIFGYSTRPAGFEAQSALGTIGVNAYGADGKDLGVRPSDVNGDGRLDLVVNGQSVWLGDGAGNFAQSASWTTSLAGLGLTFVDGDGRNRGAQLVDANGDGRPDLLLAATGQARRVFLNTGSGWALDSSYSASLDGLQEGARAQRRYLGDPCNEPDDPEPEPGLPSCDDEAEVQVQFSSIERDGDSSGAFFADVNGDRLIDIVWSSRTTNLLANYELPDGTFVQRVPLTIQAVFLNTGSGWRKDGDLSTELSRRSEFVVDSQFQGFDVLDINGDGLADILNTKNGVDRAVYLATGSGWEQDNSYSASLLATPLVSLRDGKGQGLVPADLNGDGLLDFTRADDEVVTAYRNTGTALVLDSEWTSALVSQGVQFADAEGRPTGYSFADVDADGNSDLLLSKAGTQSKISFAHGGRSDLLVRQTSALGEITEVSYAPSSAFDHRDAQGVHRLPFNLDLAVASVRRDGSGGVFGSTYEYEGGVFDDGRFRGFARTVAVDNKGVATIGSYYVSGDLSGRPFQVETLDTLGVLRRKEALEYQVLHPTPEVTQVLLGTTSRFTFDTGAAPTQVRIRRGYDAHLNLTDVYKDGDVNVSTDDVREHYTYAKNLAVGFASTLSRYEVFDAAGQLIGRTVNFFDGLAEGSVVRGDLTSVVETVTQAGATVTRQFTYDSFGLPTSARDENGALTTFTYDSSHTYRLTATDPLGRVNRTEKDPRFGLPTRETDPSGNASTRVYDGFGRLVRETLPGDESSPFGTRSVVYSNFGPGQYAVVRATESQGQSGTFDSTLFYDGFGKVYRVEAEGSDGETVVVDQSFELSGELAARTVPFFDGDPAAAVVLERDALDRVTRTVYPGGASETVVYRGWDRTQTDRRGNTSTLTVDAYDRVVRAVRNVGGQQLLTTYGYDPLGRLVRVVDPASNVTTVQFDLLGRKTQMSEPAHGTIRYTYDAKGQLLTQTDNSSRVTTFTYNAAGDLTRKALGSGEVFTLEYGDDEPNAVGLLVRMTDPAGEGRFAYDTRGNVIERRRTTGGRTYVSKYEFDSLQRIRSIRYPDGFRTRYNYEESALPESIVDSLGRPIVNNVRYTASGAVASINYGNGVTSRYAFDIESRLTSADSGKPGSPDFQADRYAYDAGGNISSIRNLTSSQYSQSFVYDELGRVTRAESGESSSYGTETYSYDASGNLTKKGDLRFYFDGANRLQPTCAIEESLDATSSLPRSNPNHPCNIGWSSSHTQRVPGSHPHQSQVYRVAHDANGNISEKNSRRFFYDSDAHLTRVEEYGRVVERNSLDVTGQRVVRWTESRETAIIDSIYETDHSQTRRHVPLGAGRLVATVATSGRTPLAADMPLWVPPPQRLPIWFGGALAVGISLLLLLLVYSRNLRLTLTGSVWIALWEATRALRFVRHRPLRWVFTLAMLMVQLTQHVQPAFAEQGGDASYPVDSYFYYHQDHLGSTKFLTNFQGTVGARREYSPFGEQLYPPGIDGPLMSDLSFNGMELERTPTAELYHFNQRQYDSLLGRFTSPDNVVPGGSPEALNRYVFNLNNPLRFADPTGRGFWDVVLGVVVVLAVVAATIATLGVAGVLTGVVLAVAIGAAIGAAVAGTAAIIAAGAGLIDTFEQGAFLTLAGAIIGGLTGGAVATASAAYGAGGTFVKQMIFGAFAGGALGGSAGASVALINGEVDQVLLGTLIGGTIGAVLGGLLGPTSFAKAISSYGAAAGGFGKAVALGKLVAAIGGGAASIFSGSFNGSAELLGLEKRLPQRVFQATFIGGLAGAVLAPFVPISSGGELGTAAGAL